MPIDVREKTIERCAREVHAASQQLWEEAETAAATEAAKKARSLGASMIKQEAEATKARHDQALARGPLVWEVFNLPGRWRGCWEMAPAFPDGRPEPGQEVAAANTLVVNPGDTEFTIGNELACLLGAVTERV